MKTQFPSIPFERYADDALAHCKTQKQAEYVKDAIAKRLKQFKLELHPEKTRIVYCKREGRNASHENVQFNFLGYTFRMRSSRNNRGQMFLTFSPAVSDKAAKTIRQTIRRWRLHRHSDKSLDEIAEYINPTVRGWLNYYGRFNKSVMVRALYTLNRYLLRWAVRKYKRFRKAPVKAWTWLGRVSRNRTELFVHWQVGLKPGAE